jgi:hypothetical protein
MAWALFLPPQDLQELQRGLDTSGMSNPDRNAANRYLTPITNNWQTAPLIPPEHPCYWADGGESRVLVINTGSLAEFRALLRSLYAKYPSATYVYGLEIIMGEPWYALDPYPPAAGTNPWEGVIC